MFIKYRNRIGAALAGVALSALFATAVAVGASQPAPASAAGDVKLNPATTTTMPTTLATASASPTDKAPPYGKK